MSKIVAVGSEDVLSQFKIAVVDKLLEEAIPFNLIKSYEQNKFYVICSNTNKEISFVFTVSEIKFSASENTELIDFHRIVLEPIADCTGGLALIKDWA